MTVFEDWNLVLAAYNSGPGNVRKAIRRSGGKTSYWEIRPFLPRETSAYVPLCSSQRPTRWSTVICTE